MIRNWKISGLSGSTNCGRNATKNNMPFGLLTAAKNPALAEKTTAQIAGSVSGAEAIPAPFDRAIFKGSAGRPAVEKTIASLVEQSKLLVESASAVGIAKLTLVEP